MSLRLLLLDHTAALGGAELYLLDVARHYRENASVLLFEEGPFADRLREEDIDVYVIPAPSNVLSVRREGGLLSTVRAIPSILRFTWQVAQFARNFDLIYANSQKALVVGSLVRLLNRTPMIWNLHDMLTADHFSPLNRRVAVTCANWFADRVIVNSEATRSAFMKSGGNVEKTGLVYNGISVLPFDAATQDNPDAIRRDLNLPNAPLIGVFSRLAPWKGQHVLVEAMTQLPETHALLVGDALFDGDVSYADRLRSQANRLDVADRVHFLGFRDDVPALMHTVDVVAHTSTAPEPFGRVIVEGMLARTPVVATRAGGATEIVDDGVTGKLVPPGDVSALATAIRTMLKNTPATEEMVDHAYAMARSRFSVEGMLDAIDEHIQHVRSR